MSKSQIIRCPNCGNSARRYFFTSQDPSYKSCPNNQVMQTECAACDYLMVMCTRNANIVEAHAPGTIVSNSSKQLVSSFRFGTLY